MRQGFSLVEMLVVMLIIGLLAAISVPYYQRSVESSRADTAVSFVRTIGSAVRLYNLTNAEPQGFGPGHNSDIAGCAPPPGPCTSNDNQWAKDNACNLFYCNYLPYHNFSQVPYIIYVGGGKDWPDVQCTGAIPGCGANGSYLVWAVRRTCPGAACVAPGSTYAGWGYLMDLKGKIWAYGGAPQPPPS